MALASRIAVLALPALALAACSKQPAPEVEGTDSALGPYVVETGTGTPEASGAAAASETPMASPVAAIPPAALGRWGLVPADCTSTRGDAKGLLTIDATSLKFYESVGKLTKVGDASDTRIKASFAFSGEGMDWTREEVLDVQDGGRTLVRREYGQDALPGPFKYTRC